MTRILSVTLAATFLHGGVALAQDEPAPAPESAPMMAAEVPPPAEPAAASASGGVQVTLFADAYVAFQSNKNGLTMNPYHRSYNNQNGFSLSFLGSDITYDTDKWGATTSVRFGPSVPIFFGAGDDPYNDSGLAAAILQAFATLKPMEGLSIDMGQFGTIYGAEVAESWLNLNYTRGALYYAYQPFWHTGARINYTVSDELSLKVLLVNGVNNTIDPSDLGLPSVGVQASYTAGPLGVTLGYLGNLDRPASETFDHFVDLVASLGLGDLTLLLNFDLGMDDPGGGGDMYTFWGGSLAARYGITEDFGIALRGEYLADKDAMFLEAKGVMTGTLTFDWHPLGGNNLIVRLDNRFEKATEGDIYFDRDGAATDTWFQSVLGVVVTSQ